jgi:hypothetical protein
MGPNEYKERASWIPENLMDCCNDKTNKFEVKLCGHSICNGCHAFALAYLKRRIYELKSDIKSTRIISKVCDVECKKRIIVVHGHTLHANHQRHVHSIACGVQSTLTHKFYHTSNFQNVKHVENIGHV